MTKQSVYSWVAIATKDDLNKLAILISSEFAPERVVQSLKDGISDAVKHVLVEKNYIDKDYRSTYYHFYSKKGRNYGKKCVRLHFFDDSVSFDAARLSLSTTRGVDRMDDAYFGYMVLRPTHRYTIGRSVLSPDIRVGACKFIIAAKHKVHLLGQTISLRGFPWMEQHSDISRCAHATCWSVLRHYSERFPSYREFLIHDITKMAQDYDPGGLVPWRGLNVLQAERVFQEAGTFPLRIHRADENDKSFYRQLAAYVDSGFPLFAALSSKKHAIAIVGYSWKEKVIAGRKLRFSWDQMESLCAVDDNVLPYLPISLKGTSRYTPKDINAFIVAFPEKIYYPAEAVERFLPQILKFRSLVTMPEEKDTIIRYFITTGSALRRFVREKASSFDAVLVQTIMQQPFAQFIWLVEFGTTSEWRNNQISGFAVIDATASPDELPLWLICGKESAVVFDRERPNISAKDSFRLLSLKNPGITFARMQNPNILRPTQKK